ncbi:hypothetical protein DH2020_025299 [Rehmannia glutinosa]|uniref:Uncharacterized protein n=1 Tax=Rehmannia glutinosa TaxID=99300 RepID=A0ABR0W035_REHGL
MGPLAPPRSTPSRQRTVREVFEAKDKSPIQIQKVLKDKSHKSHKSQKVKGSSSKDREPKDGSSSKRPRTEDEANLPAEPEISTTFNASLLRKVPNWAINGRISVLETHAGEDSFELYKHTLLESDQFILTPFDFTRLEELIAHNNFTNNALAHHMSLRAANWKATFKEQSRALERAIKKVEGADFEKAKAIEEARREATERVEQQSSLEISSLKSQVQELTDQLSKARLDLDEANKMHASERQELYNLGRARGFQEYTVLEEYLAAIKKSRLEGVRSFSGSYSYENLVARRASVYLFDGFERCKDLGIIEGAYKEDFDLNKLDPFRVDDLEKPENESPDGEVMVGGDSPGGVQEEETDEFTKLMHSHIRESEAPPPPADVKHKAPDA